MERKFYLFLCRCIYQVTPIIIVMYWMFAAIGAPLLQLGWPSPHQLSGFLFHLAVSLLCLAQMNLLFIYSAGKVRKLS